MRNAPSRALKRRSAIALFCRCIPRRNPTDGVAGVTGMKNLSMWVLSIVALGFAGLSAQKPAGNPVVEKLDPALDAIVPANAKLEILKGDYFGNIEGPLWVRQGQSGYLL